MKTGKYREVFNQTCKTWLNEALKNDNKLDAWAAKNCEKWSELYFKDFSECLNFEDTSDWERIDFEQNATDEAGYRLSEFRELNNI